MDDMNILSPSIQRLFSLQEETALVTGGTRGIGQAMALALAQAGANIILVQRDLSNTTTKEAIDNLADRGSRTCHIHVADLSSSSSVASIIPTLLSQDYRITMLLNAAGVQARHPAHAFPSADFEAVMQVNLNTTFTLCRDVGAHMLTLESSKVTGRKGTIINVASLLSFQGGITVPAYAASKGGVTQLTKALSNEWAGKGVNVNAIAPGYVNTDMNEALIADEKRSKSILGRIPMGRWGEPSDYDGVVVFLASRAAGYISGEVVVVDGGWMGR